MAKKINWVSVKEVLQSQLGEDCIKVIDEKNIALIFYEGHQVAVLKGPRNDEESNNLHFRLSTPPGIAAWIACLLRSCASFTIMSHYEISKDGEFINESELFDNEVDEDEVDEYDEEEEDLDKPEEIQSKINRNLMH